VKDKKSLELQLIFLTQFQQTKLHQLKKVQKHRMKTSQRLTSVDNELTSEQITEKLPE